MKRILQTAAFAFMIMLGGSLVNTTSAQPGYDDGDYDEGDVSYQTFYDELSPHGRWIDYPEYGYVWVPNGINGFRPYETGGHWVWTDGYEWMWVSDYSWGWAPFHYGRWFHDPFYGWMWVPGYEWAPAWVAWRDGGDYYGWAPLRPGFSIGINISIGSYNPPVDYWCFAPRRYISSPRIYDYCIDRGRNVTIINNTTIINNYGRRNNVFYNGPRRMDAERYAGRINPVRFRESSRPGRSSFRNNEVSIYRPTVRRDNNRQFTPRSFDRYERNGNRGGNNNNNNGTVRGRDNNRGNGNNLPNRRDGDNRFERRNSEVRQQPGNNDNRRFERRNVPDRQNGDNRFERRNSDVRQQPGNNDNRRFERRNEGVVRPNGNTNQPRNDDRRRRSFEQRNTEVRQQPNNDRRTERRDVFERSRNNAPSQPDRQMRNENRADRQPSRQPERQQQQSRQFENRGRSGGGDANREQRGGNNNDNRGRGRRG